MKYKQSLVAGLSLAVLTVLLGVNFVFAAVAPPTGLTGFSAKPLTQIITDIANWIAGIVALVAVVVIVIAGIMWATSGGNETQAGTAKKMLIAAVVGLLIALAALAIVRVVVGRL